MSSSHGFDWRSIELPKDIDYDELYEHIKDNPEVLDQLAKQYLSTDHKWLENEHKLQELVRNREQVLHELRQTQENNRQFDELVRHMDSTPVHVKTTTISDTIYYDNEYVYYSEPIQRVIDIEELRQRMGSLSTQNGAKSEDNPRSGAMARKSTAKASKAPEETHSGDTARKSTAKAPKVSEETQTGDGLSDLTVIFDGLSAPKKRIEIKVNQIFNRKDPKVNVDVYAASNGILTKCWKPAKITKIVNPFNVSVNFTDRTIVGGNVLPHKMIAYSNQCNSVLSIGERVIAYLEENNSFFTKCPQKELYSGTVAEPAKNTNEYRYLIFFDKHAYRYVKRDEIFPIYDKCPVENIFSEKEKESNFEVKEYAEFLRKYIKNYPERPMLRLQKDDRIRVRVDTKWETARVLEIDASLALIVFEKMEKSLKEWIYRGSRRIHEIYKETNITKSNVKHRAGRSTTRMTRRDQRSNQAFVEWNTEEPEDDKENESTAGARRESQDSKSDDEIIILSKEEANRKRKFKQTARKSTAKPSTGCASSCDPMRLIDSILFNPTEVSVERLPDLSRFKPREYTQHKCSPDCINVDAESENFYDQNPYHIPINVGYRREKVRANTKEGRTRILYRSPCGRRLRSPNEVFHYLRITESKLDVDLFTFSVGFSLFRKSSPVKALFHIEDITNGSERQPISCVNTVDETDLGNVVYKAERFPHPDVSFDPKQEFMSCCDCVDNCLESDNCACQRLTYETCDAVRMSKHQSSGYDFKRLNDFIMTGTFECNKSCLCNERCPNRVVQNGIKCRLQLFKTLKKGWGVRVLHDVPKGAFLCIYAAQILNEEAADKEGKTFGDEYLADLDYIDVCENQKEGYESDVDVSDEDYSQDSDDYQDEDDDNDQDYRYDGYNRSRPNVQELDSLENRNIISGSRKRNDDKSKNRYSIREDFFKEDFCYSLDAKKMGNIGRYLNHSCEPNCFVQNVFVDTHDLRFPWVSFFAKKDILAYEELTWDYNYEIGSIPGRKMPCYCGAHRCKRRLL